MKVKRTDRGFELIKFKDMEGRDCKLQQSSEIGDYPNGIRRPGRASLWFGIVDKDDGAGIHRLSRERAAAMLPPLELWIKDHGEGDELFLDGRKMSEEEWLQDDKDEMIHLSFEMTKGIVAHLQSWLKTGSLKLQQEAPNEQQQ